VLPYRFFATRNQIRLFEDEINLGRFLMIAGRREFIHTGSYVEEDWVAPEAVHARRHMGGGCIPLSGLFCSVLLVY